MREFHADRSRSTSTCSASRSQLPNASRQSGVALVMALVMLLILTVLGITAMSTSSLEEKMAGNIQEQTRAFEAAESGINSILRETGAMNPNGTEPPKNYSYDSDKSGKAVVLATFIEYTQPSRSSQHNQWHGLSAQYADFSIDSEGKTANTNAKSIHHQGVKLTIPAN